MLSGRVEGNYLKRDEEKTLFLKREEGETGGGAECYSCFFFLLGPRLLVRRGLSWTCGHLAFSWFVLMFNQ